MDIKRQPPFPDDLVHALGGLTLQYSSLDTQIKLLTWRLINPQIQAIGKIVTASISMTNLLNLFSSLFKLRTREAPLIDRMSAVVQRIDGLSKERNDIIHAIWVGRPAGNTALRGKIASKRRSGLVETASPVHAEDVYSLASRIEEARQDVVELEYLITNASPALRDQ